MNVKLGKERIQQLINDAIDKYENDTGEKVVRNQNPDNYTGFANKLSEISNRLPVDYPKEFEPDTGGKYDITTAQIRDALFGKVETLKPYFYEALYLYIYDKLSKDVDKKPPVVSVKSAGCQLDDIMGAMKIVRYKPTEAEIERLTGVWMVYNGSPQVRKSDPNRYNMVAQNILEVSYKERYFTFKRYGPSIDQTGYMQFEDKNLVSMHTYFKDAVGNRLIPKLSLMQLEDDKDTLNVISASWSYDSVQNVIIGIREVFTKLGTGGSVIEHMEFSGKIIEWVKENQETKTYRLKEVSLDTLPESIQPLVNENSIILKEPDKDAPANNKKRYGILLAISAIFFIATLFLLFKWYQFETIKRDMRVLPYLPTQPQIESIEGVYLVYTGSPQARKSDTGRWHMVVPCIVQVDYNTKGYFTFYRYGPKINQDGWMQFEDTNIISIHSNYIDIETKKRSVPKLALMRLVKDMNTFNIISTSWTWDINPKFNVMIGIREVFIKLGRGGEIKDVTNRYENHDKEGTTLHWTRENGKIDTTINLQNVRLETLPKSIHPLLDENSIIAKDPDSNLIIKKH